MVSTVSFGVIWRTHIDVAKIQPSFLQAASEATRPAAVHAKDNDSASFRQFSCTRYHSVRVNITTQNQGKYSDHKHICAATILIRVQEEKNRFYAETCGYILD